MFQRTILRAALCVTFFATASQAQRSGYEDTLDPSLAPTPVSVVRLPRVRPVQLQTTLPLGGDGYLDTGALVAPDDGLLLIETVTARADLPCAQHVTLAVTTRVNGQPVKHHFTMSTQGKFYETPEDPYESNYYYDIAVGTHPVRLYADAGSVIDVEVLRSSEGFDWTQLSVSLSGQILPD